MKFVYLNDTGRTVGIHPATTYDDHTPIQHLEERTFMIPQGMYPWIKMWDYGGERGLQILVSLIEEQL